jgi:hypothetical protein
MPGLSLDPGNPTSPDATNITNISSDKTVADLKDMTTAMGDVTGAQIYSSVSLSMQTASRQIAKQFGDGLGQTSR